MKDVHEDSISVAFENKYVYFKVLPYKIVEDTFLYFI